ncbi:hypothetical protein PLICRDRAFT_51900 [Plicaturopsis crispa FD-325 SS-3]|nr:hypothetical protein PLICRDRAFT_51900 [Plicaturopsis crispa FD-325 SS-3]
MVSERAQIRGSTKAVWIKTEKGVRQRSPSVVIVESTPRDKFSFEDAKALVNALAHRRGENSLKDVFEGLAGHNGHSYAQWVDFYLTHAKELNGMMPDSANAKQAGSQDGDKHGENSSVVRVVRPKRPLTPHPSAGPSRHSQRRRLGSPDEDDAGTASSEISVPLSGQRQLALTAPKNLSSNSHRKADSDSDDGSSEWEDDEESKSRLGKNYSDAEKEALARHVASIPRNSRLMKWGKLERAFSTRTASAWGKYYRSHVREVEDHIESLGLIRPDTGPYLTSTG